MKKNKIITVVLATAIALGLISCYWTPNSSWGALNIDLTALSAKGPGIRSVRVYLIANNILYPLGDNVDYVQFDYDKQTSVTLEDIPVGPIYRVAVSLGYAEPGWFDTVYWAESAAFEITAGTKAAVVFSDTELYSSDPFYPVKDSGYSMMGKNLLDVDVYSVNTYTTDGTMLFEILSFDPLSTLSVGEIPAPVGQKINSVSNGISDFISPALVVDTNSEIIPYNGDGEYNPSISSELGSVSVLDSGYGEYLTPDDLVLFFRRTNGWGGAYTYIESNPSTWIWVNQSSGKVTDMAVSKDWSGNAYFATADGAFRFSGEYLFKLSGGETPNINDYKTNFDVSSKILSLGLINPEVEVLLMGTENGVCRAGLTNGPDVIGTPQIEDGTQGHSIRRIATYYNTRNYAAYLSDAYLFVWDEGNYQLLKYPLAAGLPVKVTGMAWYYDPAKDVYYLFISGNEGLFYKEFSSPV